MERPDVARGATTLSIESLESEEAMRLVSIRPEAGEAADPTGYTVAVVLPSGRLLPLVVLAQMVPDVLADEIGVLDLARVVALDPTGETLGRALAQADRSAAEEAAIDPATVELAAPIPRPGKIVGVGYNYLEHAREQGRARPARPVLFAKFANSVIPDGAPIRKPAGTHALDFEAELAVVVGRTGRIGRRRSRLRRRVHLRERRDGP